MDPMDAELLALFQQESAERLQSLDQGLLRLEQNPRDASVVEELFREAHNLKGASRMVGAADVGNVAHRFEDLLGEARRGTLTLTAEIVDRFCRGVLALRRLVQDAVSGQPTGLNVVEVLADLSGEAPPNGPPAGTVTDGEPSPPALSPDAPGAPSAAIGPAAEDHLAPTPTPTAPASPPAAAPKEPSFPVASPAAVAPVPAPDSPTFRIDTVRVEPQRLDALMNFVGELTVTKGRVVRRLAEVEELLQLHEEWARLTVDRGSITAPDTQSTRGRLETAVDLLERLKVGLYEDCTRLEYVAGQLEEGVHRVRLLPLSTIFNLFPTMVRTLSREIGKEVRFEVEGGDVTADKRLIEEMKDPLMHILRNAVDHGIEAPEHRERAGKPPAAALRLRAHRAAATIVIEISDDGRGLDLEAIRQTALRRGVRTEEELQAMTVPELQALIFAPGFSTRQVVSDLSGRGVGMDVVREKVESFKGSIEIDSVPGSGCTVRLRLPITLATAHVLTVLARGQVFAVPVEFVESAWSLPVAEIFSAQGAETAVVNGTAVSIGRLSELLELPDGSDAPDGRPGAALPCIMLLVAGQRLGLLVDTLLDQQEVVQKPLGAFLQRVPNIAGATILGAGELCLILNIPDLMRTARRRLSAAGVLTREPDVRKQVVLLVEDSITTRTQEKRILEGAGYEVITAVDGEDAYQKLLARMFDAVVTDIEMPRLDGLGLTARIRADGRYRELPVILVTSLASDESRRRGAEVGANAYITKAQFDQSELLDALRRLV